MKREEVGVEQLAAKHGLPASEIEDAMNRLAFIRHFKHEDYEFISESQVEADFEGFTVKGHPDLMAVSRAGDKGWVWDWKTGRLEVDPISRNLQVISYAIALMQAYSGIEEFTLEIYYPRLGKPDKITLSAEELDKWRLTIREILLEASSDNPQYGVGEHCAFCDAFHQCRALNRAIAPIITDAPTVRFSELAPEKKGEILILAKLAEKWVKDIIDQAKLTAPFPVGGGKEYRACEEEQRKIDPVKAWPVLNEIGDDFGDIIKLPVGKLEEWAVAKYEEGFKEKPKRGYKAQVARDLMERLDSAGALGKEKVTKYKITNIERRESESCSETKITQTTTEAA